MAQCHEQMIDRALALPFSRLREKRKVGNGTQLAAVAALAAIMLAVAVGLAPVAAIGIGEGRIIDHLTDAYVLRILWFTLLQAGLSTLLSVALALPVALALARVEFAGRGLLLRLF